MILKKNIKKALFMATFFMALPVAAGTVAEEGGGKIRAQEACISGYCPQCRKLS